MVDYGIGNIKSVFNALHSIGANPKLISKGKDLNNFNPDHIILPGVGAVGEALRLIRSKGLEEALTNLVIEKQIPFLGICVGMQILVEVCDEYGLHKGLGWIPGKTEKLMYGENSKFKVPHIGWNNIDIKDKDDLIFNFSNEGDFYFVHSNVVKCPERYVIAKTSYGEPFVSVVKNNNIYGVQFHPEKSSKLGEQIFRRFLKYEINV